MNFVTNWRLWPFPPEASTAGSRREKTAVRLIQKKLDNNAVL
jgi:hypothetical protein